MKTHPSVMYHFPGSGLRAIDAVQGLGLLMPYTWTSESMVALYTQGHSGSLAHQHFFFFFFGGGGGDRLAFRPRVLAFRVKGSLV